MGQIRIQENGKQPDIYIKLHAEPIGMQFVYS